MIKTHGVYLPLYQDKDKFIILVTGGRGCETPTQEIIMADLSVKQIKDVREGEFVMGDDGTPRKVLATMHGTGMMYKVHQTSGEDYFVNAEHILTVRNKDKIIDVNVLDFLKSEYLRKSYKGYKADFLPFVDKNGDDSYLTITEAGEGEWCGISLDGNQRYLHSDGTVTHNSGKSFGVGAFIERLTFDMAKNDDNGKFINHQVLYTRYTMTSASISVIPEFLEKIELDGTQRYFKAKSADVVNVATGGRIMFRGIKTSSGNQTAKLKSIKGITTFVVDEAEEWTSEEDFDRIMFSIRQKGIQNRIIVIMNPSDNNHFIYKRFIKDTHKLVEYDGVPVQISTHPNVLHIHTSFLDNKQFLSEQFLKSAQTMKEENPSRYAHIFMGQWVDTAENAIFKKFGIVDEFPEYAKHVAIGMDFGYSQDFTAIVRCGIVDNRLYLEELCYKTEMLASDIIKELRKYDGTYNYVVSDSADPRLIQEIANGGIIIYPVVKGSGSIMAGIEKMLDMEIYITKNSLNLEEELHNYTWDKDKDGNLINQPIDAYNHCFVGETLVTTDKGEKRIDSVREGDMVLTTDGYCKVTRFFDQGVKRTITALLKFDDMAIKITATPDHKFRVGNRWQRFDSLQKGDLLTVCGIGKKQLKGVVVTQYKERQVYDIEVERKHEFFANGILVHNCIDASRYYVLAELLGQIKKVIKVNREELGIF